MTNRWEPESVRYRMIDAIPGIAIPIGTTAQRTERSIENINGLKTMVEVYWFGEVLLPASIVENIPEHFELIVIDPIVGTAGEDLLKGDTVIIGSDGAIYAARSPKTTKIKVIRRPGQPTEWRVPAKGEC